MYGLIMLLVMDGGVQPGGQSAPAPPPSAPAIKLVATKRAGYALVEATADKEIKQLEWIVTAGSSAPVTYDQIGKLLVVSLPASGSVTVYAVGLLADGNLAPASQLELPSGSSPSSGTPAVLPTAGAPSLRAIVAVNLAQASPAELALLQSQSLKQGLATIGYAYLFADISSTSFQATLQAAKQVAPDVPTIAPLLFVETAERKFVSASKLNLGPDNKANEQAILNALKK